MFCSDPVFQVVDADDAVSLADERVAQMRAEKARAPVTTAVGIDCRSSFAARQIPCSSARSRVATPLRPVFGRAVHQSPHATWIAPGSSRSRPGRPRRRPRVVASARVARTATRPPRSGEVAVRRGATSRSRRAGSSSLPRRQRASRSRRCLLRRAGPRVSRRHRSQRSAVPSQVLVGLAGTSPRARRRRGPASAGRAGLRTGPAREWHGAAVPGQAELTGPPRRRGRSRSTRLRGAPRSPRPAGVGRDETTTA